MNTRRYTAREPGVLANGRPLAYGDEVTLKKEEEQENEALIASGVLPELPKSKKQDNGGSQS